jgi:hypothetical protein
VIDPRRANSTGCLGLKVCLEQASQEARKGQQI